MILGSDPLISARQLLREISHEHLYVFTEDEQTGFECGVLRRYAKVRTVVHQRGARHSWISFEIRRL